jgi:hypothetical protein
MPAPAPVAEPAPAPTPEPDIEIVEADAPIDSSPAPAAAPLAAPAPAAPIAAPAPAVAPPAAGADVETLLAALAACPVDDQASRAPVIAALRRHRADGRVRSLIAGWRKQVPGEGPDGRRAIADLGAVRDKHAVPVLAQRLGSADADLATAAHASLVTITAHDYGRSAGRWARFWREHRDQHRAEWLIEALAAKAPELRLLAARELEELGGGYFGYHYDLGKREREEARRRWADWWERTGRALYAAEDAGEADERS